MKVGITIQNDYPVDREVRPRKLAKALHKRGDQVVIYARDGEESSQTQELEYATVRRFSVSWAGPLASVLTAPLPINILWMLWFLNSFRRDEIDVVVASNIRAGLPSLLVAQMMGIPRVLDLQENNPEVVKLRKNTSPLHIFTRNPRIVAVIERICVALGTEVWVVVQERKRELERKGVTGDKISVVSNTPYLEEFSSVRESESTESNVNINKEPDLSGFVLLYVGALTRYRGIDRIITAMPSVLKKDQDVKLVIAGDGPYKRDLEHLVEEYGIENNVLFAGWIPSETVPSFLAAGDIGLIPHTVNNFTNTTVPNKLFDYMSAELPVLATEMDPVNRIVEEANCGKTFDPNIPPEDLAEIIINMKQNCDAEWGQNGLNKIHNSYNWEQEMKVILSSLQSAINN